MGEAAVPSQTPAQLSAREEFWQGLMWRIAVHDQAALEALYDDTSRMVYGLALRILGDPGAAEEVTLDVYMQMWRKGNSFDPTRGRFSTWLLAVTRSRAIDRRRSFSPDRLGAEPLESIVAKHSALASPEASALLSEECRRVQAALNALTSEQRQVIELAYFAGLSQSEIAQKLGHPLGTVKTRIRNGMIKLRELLEPLEVTP